MVRKSVSGWWQLAVGIGFAAAGISKIVAMPPQRRLFTSWGWSEKDMRIMGATELAGGVLVATPALRRFGAALLTSTSICIALAELRHNDDKLVTARLAMLLAAATTGV